MSDEYENGISPAKMAAERRKMGLLCLACGKLNANHEGYEANACKKTLKTGTFVRRMTEKDIQNAEFKKI